VIDRLALTCGDPSGIGPEIVAAWLAAHPEEAKSCAAIGPASWLKGLPEALVRIPVGLEEFAMAPGRPSGEGALVAWAAMERAAAGVRDGEFSGVVTAPVSKAGLARIGFSWPGQTEFFAARWGGEPVMAFCGGRLRVVLVTWHVPLRRVPDLLSPERLERAVAGADALCRAEGVVNPRVAVCGLNPHAGEGGLLGSEEAERLDPVLNSLRARYPGLTACEPADSLFVRHLRGEFDAVIALYHDQGLAPLKAVDFEEAVNVTLGLPFVRTSPDHGTAFALAGRGGARPKSFARAVDVARRMLAARRRRSSA